MSCICDVCARAVGLLKCVCARRCVGSKGCTWREHPFVRVKSASLVHGVGPAGRWWEAATPAVPGGGDGRTPTVADARTCDADRYGMRVSCHMCAGSGKPSREWQWAETVNRTKGGGYARAFRQDAFVSTRPGRRGTRATGTGYGEISDPYRLRSDPRGLPGVFMCARGCALCYMFMYEYRAASRASLPGMVHLPVRWERTRDLTTNSVIERAVREKRAE